MKKLLGVGALLMIGGLVLYFTVFSSEKRETKVLVFSKTEGFRHNSIEPCIAAIEKLGATDGFTVEATEEATVFRGDYLKDISTVIFLNTTGDILDQQQQVQMERYIQAGGGFVGIYSATDTEYAWPWYGKLVGAYFDGHPSGPNVRTATLNVVNPNHISTDSLPTDWQRTDEWYLFYNNSRDKGFKVLYTLDEANIVNSGNLSFLIKGKDWGMGEDHPIAWYKEKGDSRIFYSAMGHTGESFEETEHLQMLENAIRWVGKSL